MGLWATTPTALAEEWVFRGTWATAFARTMITETSCTYTMRSFRDEGGVGWDRPARARDGRVGGAEVSGAEARELVSLGLADGEVVEPADA